MYFYIITEETPRVRSSGNAGRCKKQRSKQTSSEKRVYYGESIKESIMKNLQKRVYYGEPTKESILWKTYKKAGVKVNTSRTDAHVT